MSYFRMKRNVRLTCGVIDPCIQHNITAKISYNSCIKQGVPQGWSPFSLPH